MSDQAGIDLERQIHALLCNALGEAERRGLLLRIAREEPARALLAEMLTCQDSVREAFGYGRGEPAMAAGLERLRQTLTAASPPARASAPPARRVAAAWAWRLGGAAVLAASLVVAASAYLANLRTQDRLEALGAKVELSQPTSQEIASYRRIWNELAVPADKLEPLILLSDGGGRFEYTPAAQAPGGEGRFVLLRCLIVSADGQLRRMACLLLPAERPVRASLGQAGQLAGRTVRWNVAAENEWVGLDLRVGELGPAAAGVGGRVRLGEGPSEIGQFKVAGKSLRVFVQALPLAGGVG